METGPIGPEREGGQVIGPLFASSPPRASFPDPARSLGGLPRPRPIADAEAHERAFKNEALRAMTFGTEPARLARFKVSTDLHCHYFAWRYCPFS